MTKIELLRKMLLAGEEVTGLTVLSKIKYYRLSSGINTLRARGYDIKTIMVERKNEPKYAKYELERV